MELGVERAPAAILDRPGQHQDDAFGDQLHGIAWSPTLDRGLSREDGQDYVSEQTSACQVLLISSCPILASSLQRCLSDPASGIRFRSQTLLDIQGLEHLVDVNPNGLLIAPQSWEEMHRWLPPLQRRFLPRLWVTFAPPRIAGLFITGLEPVLCTVVGSGASPTDLTAALHALTNGTAICPPATLLTHFAQGMAEVPGGRTFLSPTRREFECGCGVSLGLSNRQIAEVLSIDVETIRKHIHSLLQKLHHPVQQNLDGHDLSKRETLGALFEQALSPATALKWGRKNALEM
jgi:Bacterial regulatory proteins, luxR family